MISVSCNNAYLRHQAGLTLHEHECKVSDVWLLVFSLTEHCTEQGLSHSVRRFPGVHPAQHCQSVRLNRPVATQEGISALPSATWSLTHLTEITALKNNISEWKTSVNAFTHVHELFLCTSSCAVYRWYVCGVCISFICWIWWVEWLDLLYTGAKMYFFLIICQFQNDLL